MGTPDGFGRRGPDAPQPKSYATSAQIAVQRGVVSRAILRATISGFGVIRRSPRAFATWMLFTMAMGMARVFAAFFLATGSQARFDAINDWNPFFDIDGDGLIGSARLVMPVFFIVTLTFFAVVLNRAVLKPDQEDGNVGDLGSQLLNQLVLVTLVYGGVAAFAMMMAAPLDALLSSAVSPSLAKVSTVIADLLTIFVLVKFSLASPSTFAANRLNLWESWRFTKGWFRTILITCVLAWIIGEIVVLSIAALHHALDGVVETGRTGPSANGAASLSALFAGGQVWWYLGSSASDAFVWTFALAPLPTIYASIQREAANIGTLAPLTPGAQQLNRIAIAMMIVGWLGWALLSLFYVNSGWAKLGQDLLSLLGSLGLCLSGWIRVRPQYRAPSIAQG